MHSHNTRRPLTLKESMNLAGANLVHALSPNHDFLPFFIMRIDQNLKAECEYFWASHNVGRWWDAMLRLEHATGYAIPPEAEAAMLRHIRQCLDNPLSVCGFIQSSEDVADSLKPDGWFDEHSQRETLLALACLVRFRGNRWAAEAGAKMVRALDRYLPPGADYDYELMRRICRENGVNPKGDRPNQPAKPAHVYTHGRLIEGLLEFHLATGDGVALSLADRLARLHFELCTREDGTPPTDQPGDLHTHSYLGMLRGLFRMGEITRQKHYIERVAKTYQATVRKYVLESGFISHNFMEEGSGETTSPGDAAQLALWLARAGYEEFLGDAERIVRVRILPSQITTPPGLTPKRDEGADRHCKLEEQSLGALGGMHLQPHGCIQPTTDITAADLHTLCDIYRHIAECTPDGLRINFHFDYRDDRVTVACHREKSACLKVDLRISCGLWIRVPGWTPLETVTLYRNGEPTPLVLIGRFAYLPACPAPSTVEMNYELPERNSSEILEGVTYTFNWKGDEIVGVSPNADFLPFYPTA